MDGIVHIGEPARLLGCTPEHIRTLERRGRIPLSCCENNGRAYFESTMAFLRAIGMRAQPAHLQPFERVLERTQ